MELSFGRNRRQHQRIEPPASHRAEVQVVGADYLDVFRIKDISLTGLGIRVPHRFEGCDIGVEVELVVTLPGYRTFYAHGIIRHIDGSTGDRFGIEFTQIDPKNAAQIRAYIENCQPPHRH